MVMVMVLPLVAFVVVALPVMIMVFPLSTFIICLIMRRLAFTMAVVLSSLALPSVVSIAIVAAGVAKLGAATLNARIFPAA
ncbi:hypothetical protein B0H13DRAFT_2044032 [Mycena leptocephala]|nr:hypothetical protein B0H13DRAFT_2044032 [Mycena leptocephala]